MPPLLPKPPISHMLPTAHSLTYTHSSSEPPQCTSLIDDANAIIPFFNCLYANSKTPKKLSMISIATSIYCEVKVCDTIKTSYVHTSVITKVVDMNFGGARPHQTLIKAPLLKLCQFKKEFF